MDPDTGTAGDGQGTPESQEGSIFEPYLQNVPEEHREAVGGYLKDAERNVNSKLSEAAELQKRFGDYKDIDLSTVKPQQLSEVLQWYDTVGQSPEAYKEWLRNEATEAGLIEAPAQEQEGEPDIEQYIQSRINQALEPFQQQLSQRDQAEQAKEMENHIVSTLAKLEADNKIQLTEDQEDAILALGGQLEGDDWVEKGFAKFQALTGSAQADLVKDKTNQPAPSLRTGGSAAPDKPKTFADVRGAALELMNQAL